MTREHYLPSAEDLLNESYGITRDFPKNRLKNAVNITRELVGKPTEVKIMEKFIEAGIVNFPWVPCSITATMEEYATQLQEQNKINLFRTTHEHNLGGIAAGIYLGTGELSLIHMQNSGMTNSADAFISFTQVYGIPSLVVTTWRGSNETDDSEPHQAIGKRMVRLANAIYSEDGKGNNIYGSRMGRGILRSINKAIDTAKEGGTGVIRLSPDAFRNSIKLPELHEWDIDEFYHDVDYIEEKRAEIKRTKGDLSHERRTKVVSRDAAIVEVVIDNPNAVILFSNGYTSRAAQAVAHREGNFYNSGYMGGTEAIGWGLAKSNPDIEVVVVTGDQNNQMDSMKDNLIEDYPDNLQIYVLDNGRGASVGTARSVRSTLNRDFARVFPTLPDQPNTFNHPRVGKRLYKLGDLPEGMTVLEYHTHRTRSFVDIKSEENRRIRGIDKFTDTPLLNRLPTLPN